jgi:hypothetical protein
MAIRYTRANSEYSAITSGLPAGSSALTWCAWVYITSKSTSVWSCIFGPTLNSLDCELAVDQSSHGATWALWSGSADTYSTHDAAISTWYHVALVKNGATVTLYVDGVSEVTQTWPNTGTSSRWNMGSYGGGAGDFFDGRLLAVKAWTAALSVAEIIAESVSIRPQRFADLWGWWPSLADSTRAYDYSGNGRNWTEYNTPTNEDPPPVSWGSYSGHFDVIAAGGTAYTQAVSGAVSSITGAMVRLNATAKAGVVATISGGLTRRDATAKSGALTPAGALTKRDATLRAGTVATITGALARLNATAKTGVVATISGALTRRDATAKSGALTPSGAIRKSTATRKVGSLTPSGALSAVRSVLVAVSGVVATISGALARRDATAKSGALTPSGAISKSTATRKAGSLTPSGALGAIRSVLVAVNGVVASISGGLTRLTATTKAGSTNPDGVVSKSTATSKAGSLATSGVLGAVRSVLVAVSGVVATISGGLTRRDATAKSGALTPSGAIRKSTATSKAGSLTPGGVLGAVRMILVSLVGSVGSTGILATTLQQVLRKIWAGVTRILRALNGQGNLDRQCNETAIIVRSITAGCVISRSMAVDGLVRRTLNARANL